VPVLSTFVVTSVTPRGGPPTTPIVVLGSGFGLPAGKVFFDPLGINIEATVTLWLTTRIEFTVPAGVLVNRFSTLLLQRTGATDGASAPFWVPSPDPQNLGGADFQYPAFEVGLNQDVDDPRTQTAADFNRVLDRVVAVEAAVGGTSDVMRKSVYDVDDNGKVEVSETIDDGGGGFKTWADIVALVAAATAGFVTRPYAAGVLVRDAVYQRADGKVAKTNASSVATVEAFTGVVAALDVPSVGLASVQYEGDLGGFVGLVPGETYILSTTPGVVVALSDTGNPIYPTAPGSVIRETGHAGSSTTMFIKTSHDFEENG